jgi:hypothetical protein
MKITILSILFIFLIHHLVGYFKATLTTPKVKDFIYAPSKKYKEIEAIINLSSSSHKKYLDPSQNPNPNQDTSSVVDAREVESMKNELKHFLQGLSKQETPQSYDSSLYNANANVNVTDIHSIIMPAAGF